MPDSDKENPTGDQVPLKGKKTSESDKTKSQTNAEYFHALEQWLNDARSCKYSCSFFPGFPYYMMTPQITSFPSNESQSVNAPTPPTVPFTRGLGAVFSNNQQQQGQSEEGVEYTIPPLWKRFVAETIDFVLLFFLKFSITFIAVDFFDFIDLRKYESIDQLDFKSVLEVTSEITFLEIAYRLTVCIYEGIFLRKGYENQIGGATPGKAIMGMKVVFCSSIEQVQNQPNLVKVTPATNLGLTWSFARAILKNLVLALFLPICFPFFFNKFNRSSYDILCHCVVVEDRTWFQRND